MNGFYDFSPDRERARCSRIGWSLFAMVLLTQLAGIVCLWLLPRLFPALAGLVWYAPALSILLPMLIGYPLLCLLLLPVKPLAAPEARPMRPLQFLGALVCAFGLGYLCNFVTVLLTTAFGELLGRPYENPLLSLAGTLPFPVLFLFMVVIGPILEEYIFRRVLLERLRHWGERFCMFASAAVFALAHGNLSQLLYAFAVGLVLGYVVLRFGRLRYSVLLHMLLNLPGALILGLLGPQMLYALEQQPQQMVEFGRQAAGMLAVTLILSEFVLLTILGSVLILTFRRQQLLLPRGPMGWPEKLKYRLFFTSPGIAAYIWLSAVLILFALLWG